MHARNVVFYKIFIGLIAGLLMIVLYANSARKHIGTVEVLTKIKQCSERLWKQERLLNLTDFAYLIENKICSRYEDELFAIMIVVSAAAHEELRAAHRQAITQKRLAELGIQRVFLLAAVQNKLNNSITQEQLFREHAQFGDLVQGNFIDSYRNLSYKHIMGLQWAATECKKASFIIKLDDDTIHDVFRIKRYLEHLQEENQVFTTSSQVLGGFVWTNMPVLRDNTSKWYVSPEEYAPQKYPPYLSGSFYITNPPTAMRIVEQSRKVPMMWVDDAFVTGLLREPLNIPLMELNSWLTFNTKHIKCCVHDLKTSNLECDFSIGINVVNPKTLIDFIQSSEKCYYYECTKRTKEQKLTDECNEK